MTRERLVYWQRRLGRIRLGAEPVLDQLRKHRRITFGVTGVACGLAAIIVAIFTAFRAPFIGFASALVIFGPIIALAWWDFARLSARVRQYQHELRPGSN
jgi:hypothetical protein